VARPSGNGKRQKCGAESFLEFISYVAIAQPNWIFSRVGELSLAMALDGIEEIASRLPALRNGVVIVQFHLVIHSGRTHQGPETRNR
jgi:hypothetical protein